MSDQIMKKMPYHVTIIGAGRAGSAVARLLHEAGHAIDCVVSQHETSARALAEEFGAPVAITTLNGIPPRTDFILIATGDDTLGSVARGLARLSRINVRGTVIVHLSGALTREVLLPLRQKGAITLSLHPAFPFASRHIPAARLHGVGWAVECEAKDVEIAKRLVESLHGIPVRIRPERKVLYHAGCSVASNFLVALIDSATRLFKEAGIHPHDAQKLLRPLITETLRNLWSEPDIPVNKKLTGPVARGDAETLRSHLAALKKYKDIEEMYRTLTRSVVDIAKKNGNVPPEKLRKLNAALKKS